MKIIFSILFVISIVISLSAQVKNEIISNFDIDISLSSLSDNNDGTYTNPVIFADYSDPDVIRVDDDYYLVSSSFSHFPGLPILHSKDLVNWKLIAHAVNHYPFKEFDLPQHGNGIWAPSIRYHNKEYWIYFGDPDHGIMMTKAKDPRGPWSPLHVVKEAKGWIDPCPFWDDDGNAYLVHAWAKSRSGINSILTINKMSSDGRNILDDGIKVFDGHENHPTIEGPKLYKKNGYYYIFAPAGGVTPGWQTVLRSKNIYGPYEDKIVLEQGSTNINGPHQGAWVELENKKSWFIHFQDREPYGRIVHLQPMEWEEDWPIMGIDYDGNNIGEPISVFSKPVLPNIYNNINNTNNDEFSNSLLNLNWQWQANFKNHWYSLSDNGGNLRLFSNNSITDYHNLWEMPNILAQKFPSEEFDITTKLSFHPDNISDRAGLIILGNSYAVLQIKKNEDQYIISLIVCKDANENNKEVIVESHSIDTQEIFLKAYIREDAVCTFSYSLDGELYFPFSQQFQASEGRWVGAKVGLFCTSKFNSESNGYADFDFFNIVKF